MSNDLEVLSVIRTRLLRRGDGTEHNPIRIIEQYWTMDGNLLFEADPLTGAVASPRYGTPGGPEMAPPVVVYTDKATGKTLATYDFKTGAYLKAEEHG